jgi:hypothetical protein
MQRARIIATAGRRAGANHALADNPLVNLLFQIVESLAIRTLPDRQGTVERAGRRQRAAPKSARHDRGYPDTLNMRRCAIGESEDRAMTPQAALPLHGIAVAICSGLLSAPQLKGAEGANHQRR